MKRKVSDYIADFLSQNSITDCFAVTGGASMHLNDSLGHHKAIKCTYFHHEQAAAMAAEAYARIDNKIAIVCVSTGPGATNAITGVLCGWMGSIPMLILSGQVRYETTVHASGLKLRTRGIQEYDITSSVNSMTKYCDIVTDPGKIRYMLEKALYLAKNGRPGPCWLDIPLDVQGATIETEDLEPFYPNPDSDRITNELVEEIINKVRNAKRPVMLVGNGVRLAGAHSELLQLVDRLNIPVVTGVSSVDAISGDHILYIGRCGITGDRAGNFAVQNSDLLLTIGSRLSILQTGFNYESWARSAFKIVCDIDDQELQKDSINADMRICCDAKKLINAILTALPYPLKEKANWNERCRGWKEKYPVVLDKHRCDIRPNIYAFYENLTEKLGCDDRLVVSVGTARVVGSQASYIKEGMRFITNASAASMGYCLPAAIGVCIAEDKRKTYLVTGDGSLQMNIQELQTIVQNKLPIAIFVMNNNGYHSIRMTQNGFFGNALVGVGPDSGDISFPDLSKIALAYGIAYRRCETMTDMKGAVKWAIEMQTACICEMMLSTEYIIEPKAASKRLADGNIVSAPLEDMAPFLGKTEIEKNMIIPMI